jgi:hypothetical protein
MSSERSLSVVLKVQRDKKRRDSRPQKHPVYNLHVGRWRGLTWHDVAADVIWLLGVGWHEADSHDDVYEMLKNRDVPDELMPSDQDYLDLEMSYDATWTLSRP